MQEVDSCGSDRGKITVIIPTLNEAEEIGRTLESIQQAENVETLVVDGGSQDDTVNIADKCGCRIISSACGRAIQMNRGAAEASGEIFVFLHGDTRLPAGFDAIVRETLSEPRVVAGAFRLSINGPRPALRWIERTVNLRSRLLQLPYGDQAVFLRRQTFMNLGRFPELPILEDFLLVRKLRRLGRIRTVAPPVITSARRWQQQGIVRTTVINQAIIVGYYVGIRPARLARWYGRLPS